MLAIKVTNYIILISIFIYGNTVFAAQIPAQIEKSFLVFENSLSDMACSSAATATDLKTTDRYFRKIIRKYPAIISIMRINSNGIIVNKTHRRNKSFKMRDISYQKWFSSIKADHKPVYTTSKDSANGLTLFWAWPIKTSPDSKIFSGVLAVKISVLKVIQSAEAIDIPSFQIRFKGKKFEEHKWNNSSPHTESNLSIPGSADFSIRFVENSEPAETKSTASKKIANTESAQNSLTPLISNSANPQHSKPGFSMSLQLFLIFMGSGLAATLFILKKRKAPPESQTTEFSEIPILNKPLSEKNDTTNNSDFRKETILLPQSNQDDASNQSPDTTSKESLPESAPQTPQEIYNKIKKSVFKEATQHFRSAQRPSEDDKNQVSETLLQQKIYREIHSQITQWIIYESARLTHRLEELNEKIQKLENSSSSLSQIDQMEKEAAEISKEIKIFKDHFSDHS